MPLATPKRVALAAVVALATSVTACGARTPLFDVEATDVGPDVEIPDANAPEVEAPDTSLPEATPDEGPPCMPPTPTATACNDLTPSGQPVTVQCAAGAPPPPTGGTVTDGTYEMVSSTFFGSDCPVDDVEQIVWTTCGPYWTTAEVLMGDVQTNSIYVNGSATFGGASVTLTTTCSTTSVSGVTYGYDATPTTLTLHIHGFNGGGVRIDQFARQ
jgi:predicted small lipoprotein YifL